jgi:hypothetical protein
MTDIGMGAPLAPDWDNPSYFDDTVTAIVDEEQAKVDGMARAANASASWQQSAREWFDSLDVGTIFTADDLTTAIGVPSSPGAVGAAFNAASSRTVIEAYGTALSTREGRHRSLTRSWRKVTPSTEVTVKAQCTGCGAICPLDQLHSKYGKPQLVGEVRGKRLWEAKCHACDKPSRAARMQAIWKER